MSGSPSQPDVVSVQRTQRSIKQLLLSGRYWIYLLILVAVALVHYTTMFPSYFFWLNPWVYAILIEIHDAFSIVPITLAARRFRGIGGYVASIWFGLVHVPYFYMMWPDVGPLARIIVICGIGCFVSYLVDLYYKESGEREKAYRDMLAARERLNHVDQLYQTEKMNALGRVAAGVAHDFNNILAAILFQAEVVLRQTKEETIRPGLKNIQQAAMDGAETVKRIRDFTRTRPLVEELATVDVKKVVEDAVEMSQPQWKDQAQARGATIQIITSLRDAAPIRGNAAQLQQVLVNLIINAVEAMPHGGAIRISASSSNSSVTLTVADDGIGMDDETVRRAFDPFFTTKGPPNTGLGLTAAYSIIVRHGGSLAVQSKKGQGTTFTITLPTTDHEKEPVVPSAPVVSVGKPLNILVVDDEPLVAGGLGELLRLEGHRVSVHTSPLQALAEFQRGNYDVVFTDLGMPDMNGWQLCAKIKESSPHTPVVMLTGWGEDVMDKERPDQGEVDFLLGKPVVAEKVSQIINEIVGLRQNQSAE